jgi:hypothetical protein
LEIDKREKVNEELEKQKSNYETLQRIADIYCKDSLLNTRVLIMMYNLE